MRDASGRPASAPCSATAVAADGVRAGDARRGGGVRRRQRSAGAAAVRWSRGTAAAPATCVPPRSSVDARRDQLATENRGGGLGAPAEPVGGGSVLAVAVPHAARAHAEVGVHQVPDVGLGEQVVAAQRVLDPRGGQELAGVETGEVRRTIGLVADLAQAARELGGRAQRRHAIALDEPRDRGVVNPGLQRELPLAHLLLLQLAAEPGVEGAGVLEGHALCPYAVTPPPTREGTVGGASEQPDRRSGTAPLNDPKVPTCQPLAGFPAGRVPAPWARRTSGLTA